MKTRRSAPKKKLRAIALKAANKMAQKTTWCQGNWALTKDGGDPREGADGCTLPSVRALEREAERSQGPEEWVDSDYFAANSPKAQLFCVEGMIYNAAGKVFKRAVPGYRASRQVIALLDAKVEADPSNDFTNGMGLNDYNGDASRKALVGHLRAVAKDLA